LVTHSFFIANWGINLHFLLAAGQLWPTNFAKVRNLHIRQTSAIVLYCLHYTLQKTRSNCDEREKQKPLLLQTTSYMICAENNYNQGLYCGAALVWRAYQPIITPQLPNIMLQAESVYLDPVSYKNE